MVVKENIRVAMNAHTDLNTFASLQAILEGGCLHGPTCYKSSQRIIAICKKEMQKQLAIMDKAIATKG